MKEAELAVYNIPLKTHAERAEHFIMSLNSNYERW